MKLQVRIFLLAQFEVVYPPTFAAERREDPTEQEMRAQEGRPVSCRESFFPPRSTPKASVSARPHPDARRLPHVFPEAAAMIVHRAVAATRSALHRQGEVRHTYSVSVYPVRSTLRLAKTIRPGPYPTISPGAGASVITRIPPTYTLTHSLRTNIPGHDRGHHRQTRTQPAPVLKGKTPAPPLKIAPSAGTIPMHRPAGDAPAPPGTTPTGSGTLAPPARNPFPEEEDSHVFISQRAVSGRGIRRS